MYKRCYWTNEQNIKKVSTILGYRWKSSGVSFEVLLTIPSIHYSQNVGPCSSENRDFPSTWQQWTAGSEPTFFVKSRLTLGRVYERYQNLKSLPHIYSRNSTTNFLFCNFVIVGTRFFSSKKWHEAPRNPVFFY